jgi:galactose oxidase-like protein
MKRPINAPGRRDQITRGSWIFVGAASGPSHMGGAAQVLAVHAALLPVGPAGQILYLGGDDWVYPDKWQAILNQPNTHADPAKYTAAKSQIDNTRLFDCKTQQISNPGTPDFDVFCCGHAFLPDGTLLVAGGTQDYVILDNASPHNLHFGGSRQSWIFYSLSQRYVPGLGASIAPAWDPTPGPLLNPDPDQGTGGGRWYPTLVTLPDGSVIAMCGHPLNQKTATGDYDGRHNNTKPEIFEWWKRSWRLINKPLGAAYCHDYAPYYPRLHVLPHSGDILTVQPLYSRKVQMQIAGGFATTDNRDVMPPYGIDVMDMTICYDPVRQDVTRAFPGPQSVDPLYVIENNSQSTTSVLLPLLPEEKYHPRVLLCGGETALIADLSPQPGAGLEWKPTASRALGGAQTRLERRAEASPIRQYLNATLLPTGDVVITGGVNKPPQAGPQPNPDYLETDGVKTVEIYHPAMGGNPDSWDIGAAAQETRGYHSVALLMADGRVWTAGGEILGLNPKSPAMTTPDGRAYFPGPPNFSIELFEPTYYHVQGRTLILDSPVRVGYGQRFLVTFDSTQDNVRIVRVAFMRCGSVTPAFDGDQRYVGADFVLVTDSQGVLNSKPLMSAQQRWLLQQQVDGMAEKGKSLLVVTAPPDGTIAPPGYYMLWLIDSKGLPCQTAAFIQISRASRILQQYGGSVIGTTEEGPGTPAPGSPVEGD